jgi:hypothetical protein
LADRARDAATQDQERPGSLRQGKAHSGPGHPQGLASEGYKEVCYLGHLAHEVDWKYQAVTATLEEKRTKAKIHYRKKKQLMRLRKQAEKNMEKKIKKFTDVLKTQDSWYEPNKDLMPQKTKNKNKNKQQQKKNLADWGIKLSVTSLGKLVNCARFPLDLPLCTFCLCCHCFVSFHCNESHPW